MFVAPTVPPFLIYSYFSAKKKMFQPLAVVLSENYSHRWLKVETDLPAHFLYNSHL